jgi:UDP-glucose 6-dehydrogenase
LEWICRLRDSTLFEDQGHDVTGVDVGWNKVEMINRSQSSIIEPRMVADIIKREQTQENFAPPRIQQNWELVSLICVATPALN